jgi:mRNA interferase MazF
MPNDGNRKPPTDGLSADRCGEGSPLVDLKPVRGAEADKRRPAVIVSNDVANVRTGRLGRGVITVVPVTSNVNRVLSFQVLLPAVFSGLDQDSKAQAEQVRPVAVERVGPAVGRLSPSLEAAIDDALRLHFHH